MSVVDSATESEGSKSLDTIKLDRDVIVAKHELARIEEMCKCEEQKRQIVLKEYDAKTGLSKRSPNTSRASSMRSGGRSTVHDNQRSPLRASPDTDNDRKIDFEEVIKGEEGEIVTAHDVSIDSGQSHSPRGNSSGGSPQLKLDAP
jgi:hypothetical protein